MLSALKAASEDELEKQLGTFQREPLQLHIHEVAFSQARITLKGGVFADLLHAADNFPVARLEIVGLGKKVLGSLHIFQILTCEGYVLEKRGDLKLAFFTYFSAIEALVSRKLEDYRATIHSELHYALEHLSLDEKIRIAAKETLEVEELINVAIWGELMGAFKRVKNIRNQIAHARAITQVGADDVADVFLCLFMLVALFEIGAQDFSAVRKYINM